jgi:release factor glutamine methyltransferase
LRPTNPIVSPPLGLASNNLVTDGRILVPPTARRPATVGEALRWGRAVLVHAGFVATETPGLDADVLLRHVLGWDRAALFTRDHEAVSPTVWRRFRALVVRRTRAEPVAYLIGTREFAGLTFSVDRRVLIPRPDTEILVEIAIKRLAPKGGDGRAADVGTGSGAIAISLARACPTAVVHAIDIDPGALRVARGNARRLKVGHRLRFHLGNGLGAARAKVDVVCANLPYVPTDTFPGLHPTVRNWEPRHALVGGHDGLDPYRNLLLECPRLVRTGGTILMECDPEQADALSDLARGVHPGVRVRVHRDLAGRDRVVEACIPMDARGHEPSAGNRWDRDEPQATRQV